MQISGQEIRSCHPVDCEGYTRWGITLSPKKSAAPRRPPRRFSSMPAVGTLRFLGFRRGRHRRECPPGAKRPEEARSETGLAHFFGAFQDIAI